MLHLRLEAFDWDSQIPRGSEVKKSRLPSTRKNKNKNKPIKEMAGTSGVTNQQSGLFTEWTGQLSDSWKIHRRQLKWIITELFPLLNCPLRTSTHVKKTHEEVGINVQVSKRQVKIHMLKCKYKPLVTMKSKKTRTEKFWQMKPRVTWYSYQNDGMRKLWRSTKSHHNIF